MHINDRYSLTSAIIKKAKGFGADLVGITSVEELKKEPSSRVVTFIPPGTYGSQESPYGLKPGEVLWPEGGQSVVVIGLAHPENQPELDWWYWLTDPPGNRLLKDIIQNLKVWLLDDYQINAYHISYHIEKGGLFLKEAAKLSGLGCIGRNNLLITPQFGPRLRLRAMVVNELLVSTGPSAFDPCQSCETPCLASCPNRAFKKLVLTKEQTGEAHLPGRDGFYCRENCAQIMQKNEDEAELDFVPEISHDPIPIIKYCRNCEISCPIGK